MMIAKQTASASSAARVAAALARQQRTAAAQEARAARAARIEAYNKARREAQAKHAAAKKATAKGSVNPVHNASLAAHSIPAAPRALRAPLAFPPARPEDRYIYIKSAGASVRGGSFLPLESTAKSGGISVSENAVKIKDSGFYYVSWSVYTSNASGEGMLYLALEDIDNELEKLNGSSKNSDSRVIWFDAGSTVRLGVHDALNSTTVDGVDLLIIHMG
jgi:hypothetical protein